MQSRLVLGLCLAARRRRSRRRPDGVPLGPGRRAAARGPAAHGRLRLVHGDDAGLHHARPGRRAAPHRALRGRELDRLPRRPGLDLQAPEQPRLPQRPEGRRERRPVLAEPPRVAGFALPERPAAPRRRGRLRGRREGADEGARRRARGGSDDGRDPTAGAAQGGPADAADPHLDGDHRAGGGRAGRRELGGDAARSAPGPGGSRSGCTARGSSTSRSPSTSRGSRRWTGWRCPSCRSRRRSSPCTRTASSTSSWSRSGTTRGSSATPGGARRCGSGTAPRCSSSP